MKAKCPKCEYEWECKSIKIYVTCPNCIRKIKIKLTAKQALRNFSGLGTQ